MIKDAAHIKIDLTCPPDAKIVITGAQWSRLMEDLAPFQRLSALATEILTANMDAGILTSRYVYEDGTEVPKEDLARYAEAQAIHMKQMFAKMQPVPNDPDAPGALKR